MQRMNGKEVAKCHYDYMHVSIKKLLLQENIINFCLGYCWWPCIDAKCIFDSGLYIKMEGEI